MKKINLGKGREIETPWLTIEEAAAYCGMGRSTFFDHADEVPSSGHGKSRKFKASDLDVWMEKQK